MPIFGDFSLFVSIFSGHAALAYSAALAIAQPVSSGICFGSMGLKMPRARLRALLSKPPRTVAFAMGQAPPPMLYLPCKNRR
jgi:hypothetical protein